MSANTKGKFKGKTKAGGRKPKRGQSAMDRAFALTAADAAFSRSGGKGVKILTDNAAPF